MRISQEKVLKILEKKQRLKTKDIALIFSVSRQRAHTIMKELVDSGKLMKLGSTAKAFYVAPEFASKHLDIFPNHIEKRIKNINLEEHKILDDLENKFPQILRLDENIRSIFTYAFSEMLNNAIEHSLSKDISITITLNNNDLVFYIIDFGVGVFRNIKEKKQLKNELEAIQELLKGKTTTQPKVHSGEGIFFTSKIADKFMLDSYGYQLIIDNQVDDVFLNKIKSQKKGTKVVFSININSKKHLSNIFLKYDSSGEGEGRFDKTEIRIKLYAVGGVHVSRSEARRVLTGLEKFKVIILDFDKVPMIGQAFADEIFRVFHEKKPDILINPINMNEGVKFMIDRVEGNNPRKPTLFG
jgi:anti-sigma regulatory factor (Ser/Thr protein kinase)